MDAIIKGCNYREITIQISLDKGNFTHVTKDPKFALYANLVQRLGKLSISATLQNPKYNSPLLVHHPKEE